MIVLKIPQVSVALGSKYSQKHVDSRLGTIEGDEKTLEKRRKHEERRDDVSLLFLQTHFLFMFNHCYFFFFFNSYTNVYEQPQTRAPTLTNKYIHTPVFPRLWTSCYSSVWRCWEYLGSGKSTASSCGMSRCGSPAGIRHTAGQSCHHGLHTAVIGRKKEIREREIM